MSGEYKQKQTALHQSLILLQKKPYTLDQLAKKLNSSKNTAKRSIEKIQAIKWIKLVSNKEGSFFINM